MKKNKILCLICAALAAASLLAGCSGKKDSSAPDGMKLASDPEVAGYTLYVPEDWDVDMRTSSTRAHCTGEDKSFVMVMVGDSYSSVDQWWENGIEELNALYSDFTLISTEDMKLDGVDAKKYVYSGSFGGAEPTEFKYTQTAAVKNGTIYVVTFGAEADRWESHSDEVNSMLSEFRFGK